MEIKYSTFTDAGIRPNNQDYLRVVEFPEQKAVLSVLCDGIGGHLYGEFASKLVVDVVVSYFNKTPGFKICEKKIQEACHKASIALDKKSTNMGHAKMGTTFVMAYIEDNILYTAHIGDTRAYLLRKGDIVYQTQDHVNTNFGWETLAKCFISYKREVAEPTIRQFEIQSGDVLFLCSDGVNKYVRPDILKERLLDDTTPENIVDGIKSLCQKNSPDNYSGIYILIK